MQHSVIRWVACAVFAVPVAHAQEQADDGAAAVPERPPAPRTSGGPGSGGDWEFGYHGYFRAPMRVGVGQRDDAREGQGSTTLHSPIIPDDQYLSWQNTAHNRRDWAEMFLSVGNGTASGHLALQGFQFTDASWAYPEAIFGIGQGWVEIDSGLGSSDLRLNAKAGSFWARYGMAGRYDAGEYDTFLFGRTHVLGATTRLDADVDGKSVGVEVGVGVNRPNPQMFNRARFTSLAHAHAFFSPTEHIELSAHLMHSWAAQEVIPQYPAVLPASNCPSDPNEEPNGLLCLTDQDFSGGVDGRNGVFGPEYPNGALSVFGLDGRFDLGAAGSLYAGWSRTLARNALVVGPALETLHSFGGGTYRLGVTDNYLESPFCPVGGLPRVTIDRAEVPQVAPNGSCSNGTGHIDTFLAQYELSAANLELLEPGRDLRIKLYGMLNQIHVDPIERRSLAGVANAGGVGLERVTQDGTRKLKFGLDTEFFAYDWVSAGLRADRLQPHSKVPEQSFTVVSPRLTFRSQMITREQIVVQYSRYLYDQRTCSADGGAPSSPADNPHREGDVFGGTLNGLPARVFCVQPPAAPVTPDGFGAHTDNQAPGNRGAPSLRPDVNVIKVEASMWW